MDEMPNFTSSDLENYFKEDLGAGNDFHREFKLSPLHNDENFAEECDAPPIMDSFPAILPQEASLSLSPTCTIPCRDDFSGPLNFEILLDSTTAHRKSWLYSHLLRKVFIDIHKSLLVQFKVQEYTSGLRIRALPVFSMDDFVSTPVQRCALHELSDDSLRQAHRGDPQVCFCRDYRWVRHVVRSNHPQARYEYDVSSDRHSVLVPLDAPQAGSDIATVGYHFTCKTSCTRGMNRKPIDVIFTLETELCQVIGRQILSVKICSCPKRDKDKEEADASSNKAGTLAKRRMSSSDKQEITKKIKLKNNLLPSDEHTNDESVMSHNQEHLGEQLKEFKSQISSQATKLSELQNEVYQLKNEVYQLKNELVSQKKILEKVDSKLDDIFQHLNRQPCNFNL